MTLTEIAMIKKFLRDRGFDELFISLYTKYRLVENPLSIEQYMIEADASEVLTKAFSWVPNSHYGYDFWSDMQRRFDRYRIDRVDEFPISDIRGFKGKAKSLRWNWDNVKFWHDEKKEDVAKRYEALHSELEPEPATEEKTPAVEDDIMSQFVDDPIAGFDMIDLSAGKRTGQLRDNEISMNLRNNHSRINFSKHLSKTLGGYKYAMIGSNANGEVALMLNNSRGVHILEYKGIGSNMSIGNKEMCKKLKSMMKLEGDYFVLTLKEIAKTDSYIAFTITNTQK